MYCLRVGSNGEPSIEKAILKSTPCEVHTFGHTLDASMDDDVLNVPGINMHLKGPGSESAAAHKNLMSLSAMLARVQRKWIDVRGIIRAVSGEFWRTGTGAAEVLYLRASFQLSFILMRQPKAWKGP